LFSGIVEEVGEVIEVTDTSDGRRLKIRAAQMLKDATLGESISVSGCCLTVVQFDCDWFCVEAVIETLRRTKCGSLKQGSAVNLEKALRVSDRLGGHIVTGHIDTVAKVAQIKEEGFSSLVTLTMDGRFAPFFVEKGSVCVDGVSLTVADCGPIPAKISVKTGAKSDGGNEFWFKVALIPHTLGVTTLGSLKVGSEVNIETDIIARYVARLTGTEAERESGKESTLAI
jgi:riboflavin synthase